MKIRNLLLFLFMFAFAVSKAQTSNNNNASTSEGIQFFKGDFNAALAEAKKQNKPLFVDFYAVWCVPCKQMAKNVFTLNEVGTYMNPRFISLQIDAEKPENVEIAKKYKVEAYPTVVFIAPDGKALSVNVGALNKQELLEAAKIAAGETVSFEDLYNQYKANNADLAIQQALLLKAPNFLGSLEGIEADKWVTRINKLYRSYLSTKKPTDLINNDDYRIILALEGDDDMEHKQSVINLINEHLDAWTSALGKAPAFYIVETNDAFAENLAKEGDKKYSDYVENIKTLYAKAYDVTKQEGVTPYEKTKLYYDALFNLYKSKDVKGYVKAMQTVFNKMGASAQPTDFGKAAQDLYKAAAKSLKPEDHRVAIEWVTKALTKDDAVMDRVNYLVMIGDSYRHLKEYTKAREYYNQGFAESLRMANMEMAQAMVQGAIKQKLSALELLEK